MPESFRSLANDPRPVESMSRAQIGLILGINKVLLKAGLVLTCPRCALDGHPQLETHNDPTDDIWKIDCKCRRRRIARTELMMVPTGWLLLMVEELLAPLSLDVRCPSKRCLLKPLKLHQSVDGLTFTVACHCGGSYTFEKTKQSKPN